MGCLTLNSSSKARRGLRTNEIWTVTMMFEFASNLCYGEQSIQKMLQLPRLPRVLNNDNSGSRILSRALHSDLLQVP
jgi:hypothetical protein